MQMKNVLCRRKKFFISPPMTSGMTSLWKYNAPSSFVKAAVHKFHILLLPAFFTNITAVAENADDISVLRMSIRMDGKSQVFGLPEENYRVSGGYFFRHSSSGSLPSLIQPGIPARSSPTYGSPSPSFVSSSR